MPIKVCALGLPTFLGGPTRERDVSTLAPAQFGRCGRGKCDEMQPLLVNN